jgi:hypothetical protein
VLEVLLDVTAAKPGRDTVQRVDLAAQALAQSLADAKSINWYRKLVWGLYRSSQRGTDHFQIIYQMAIRARVDLVENFSRKGGAVFVSRLTKAGLLDELMQT